MPSLYVICGHGAGDPGACAGGCSEAALVRELACRMAAIGGAEAHVLDMSRNWYADGGVDGALKALVGSVPVVELHMDSAAPSARGGHVVVKAGLEPDAYDRALADAVTAMFPGRSTAIVGRGDLANPNRAAAHGINYRLLECCFISNDGDRALFVAQMDEVARAILGAFGIATGPTPEQVEQARVEGLPDALKGYRDLWPGSWYVEPVLAAVEAGVMRGRASDAWAPDEPITRAEAVAVVANRLGADVEPMPYDDIAPWYAAAIVWAEGAGVLAPGDHARPDDAATRAEVATMLWRAAGGPAADASKAASLGDWGEVPEWARQPVAWAVAHGLMGNGGAIDADGACTRAMAAAMTMAS